MVRGSRCLHRPKAQVMQIPGHLNKASKLNCLRTRLDPLEDFELWFWATMNAGTHALNATLHHAMVYESRFDAANLAGADLSESMAGKVQLIGAVLRGANLSGTDMRSGRLNDAFFT